ncbi:MAG: HD domain-containing phosphohydrolase [Longimicrobiales bacterium]
MASRAEARSVKPTRIELVSQAHEHERLGHNLRARACYEAAVRQTTSADSAPTIAALLRWIGSTHRADGDLDAAADCYQLSFACAELNVHTVDMAHALNWLAVVEQERGHMQSAHELYARGRLLALRAGEARLAAMIGQNLGSIAVIRGQHARAVRHYQRSLHSYRALGDLQSTATLLNNLALVQMDRARWQQAADILTEAAALCERLDDRSTRAMIEVNRVDLLIRRGQIEPALRTCKRAHSLAARAHHKIALAEVYKCYGTIYRELGQAELAETHLEAAGQLARRCEHMLLRAETQRELARLYLTQDRNPAALRALNEAHHIFEELRAKQLLQGVDRILHDLQAIFLDVVRRWGDSIEQKDRYTRGHCQRVADYACELARAVGFEESAIVWFRMGAFLHDVGKTAIPAEILNKHGPLTAVERQTMEQHTVVGEALLSSVEFPWDIRPMIRSHHERWDGQGYPDGLRGEEIPLAARVLCIVDVYDALTTDRPYRRAHTPAAALHIMRADVGAFDPVLLGLFEDWIRSPVETAA